MYPSYKIFNGIEINVLRVPQKGTGRIAQLLLFGAKYKSLDESLCLLLIYTS